jgi:eukaryotic-like serine/threonine-protein kinase
MAGLAGTLVLDRYVIDSELGSGAMGVVFRGHHARLPHEVAIKVMHDHLAGQQMQIERFRREGRLALKLHHPNVAAVLDVGELADGRLVMVMELAQGRSLTDLMEAPLSRPRLYRLIKQLLQGLDHAHSLGLVHRDLKPENVIVEQAADGSEHARIVDFGIAVLRSPEEDEQRLTGTGMIIGSPLYMAPEQAKCEPVDHRADLYALGIMVYELLAGTAPFNGTAMEVAATKIDHDPPPIAGLEPVLQRYLDRLLARDPAGRFASAQHAHDMLELVERDPREAASRLGIIDVPRALAMISLPEIP